MELICKNCNSPYTTTKDNLKAFKCKTCGKSQRVITELIEQPTENFIQTTNETSENIVEESKDINIKVEPVKTEFISTTSNNSEIKNISRSTPTSRNTGSTLNLIKGETCAKLFKQVDAVMVSKSNKEIWDVSAEEEKNLGEQWAEVINLYAPKMESKEAKLIVATISTGAVYVPRIIDFTIEYRKRKGNKTKKVEELATSEKEMTNEEIEQAKKPPQRDENFGSVWDSKRA